MSWRSVLLVEEIRVTSWVISWINYNLATIGFLNILIPTVNIVETLSRIIFWKVHRKRTFMEQEGNRLIGEAWNNYFLCRIARYLKENRSASFPGYWPILEDPSWSYGNYLYNQCLSPLMSTKLVSSNPTHGEVYSIQHYVIKVFLATCDRSVVFSGYSGFLNQYNWQPRYN
jgi:hypothetical protein